MSQWSFMYVDLVHVYNLAEFFSKDSKLEMENMKYHIEEEDQKTNSKKWWR